MHRLRQVTLMVVIPAIVGCGPKHDHSERGHEPRKDRALISVGSDSSFRHLLSWQVEPSVADRVYLDSVLLQLERQANGPAFHGGGTLYRLDQVASQTRYLLIGFREPEAPSQNTGRGDIGLYVIARGAGVSPAYTTGVPDRDVFSLKLLRDFDGDGFPDVAYCYWDEPVKEDDPAVGSLKVVGNSSGEWYEIRLAPTERLNCADTT